jgi:hypothetical protein
MRRNFINFVWMNGQRRRWDDNIKIDMKVECGSDDLIDLLSIRFSDRLL